MTRALVALLLAALPAAGCASPGVRVTRIPGGGDHAPIREAAVRVFYSEGDVPGPFQRVANIHAYDDTGYSTVSELISEARKAAAGLGANGIIVVSTGGTPPSVTSLTIPKVGSIELASGETITEIVAVRYGR